MKLRVFASLAAMAVFVLMGGSSCRREQVESSAVKGRPPVSGSVASPSRTKPVDTNLLAAIGRLQRVERDWQATSSDAAAALQQLKETQAAYQKMIASLGLYTAPNRERETRMRELSEAVEQGDAARVDQAEKAFQAACEKVDQGEARIRLGNPQIQKAFDAWKSAQRAYVNLRASKETISKASEDVTRLTKNLENGGNDGLKEN